jgi:hypothetical protein
LLSWKYIVTFTKVLIIYLVILVKFTPPSFSFTIPPFLE